MKCLNKQLKNVMKNKELTFADVVQGTGLTETEVTNCLYDFEPITSRTAQIISSYFGYKMGYLFVARPKEKKKIKKSMSVSLVFGYNTGAR